jgi:hypothetical protein
MSTRRDLAYDPHRLAVAVAPSPAVWFAVSGDGRRIAGLMLRSP